MGACFCDCRLSYNRGGQNSEEMISERMDAMKWLLIIPMALFEIVFLGVCWIAAFFHPPTGKRLAEWSIRTLPGPNWYSK